MDFGQRLRRLLRGGIGRAGEERPATEVATPPRVPRPPRLMTGDWPRILLWTRRGAIAIVLILVLYYPLGAILDHKINDDPDFAPPTPAPGASHTVAVAAALLTREIDDTGWVANTPPFASNALLKYGGNMMNFQIGITTAIGVVSVELRDQIGRQRGSSQADADLRQAASDIQYDPERWIWRWGRVLPEASAEDQYRSARDHLLAYNVRLAAGGAIFDPRPDNLLAVLERIAIDLGDSAAQLDSQIVAGRLLVIDRQADKLLYNVKGRAYAYLMILRGLREDFAAVLVQREIATIYDDMLESLEVAATLQPAVTQNGARDGVAANNHLAVQGFYVLLARTKLREMTDILAK
jgi:hypothetical protein